VVVFPFAFHIAVQQPLKPLWSRLLLCDHEPSQPSTVLCFMSLLMSLLPASGKFLSEFPSPRVILSFFPHPWPYRLGWACQELKLPPASLSGHKSHLLFLVTAVITSNSIQPTPDPKSCILCYWVALNMQPLLQLISLCQYLLLMYNRIHMQIQRNKLFPFSFMYPRM
jgi:hypothetical protein